MAPEEVKDLPITRLYRWFEARLAILTAKLLLLQPQWPFHQIHHCVKLWLKIHQPLDLLVSLHFFAVLLIFFFIEILMSYHTDQFCILYIASIHSLANKRISGEP